MQEINRDILGNRMENIGVLAIGLGILGTSISGILFLGSEQNISPADVQRLSKQVNVFFETGMASIFIAGSGAVVSKIGERIKK